MNSPWRSIRAWAGLVVCLVLTSAVTLGRPDLTEEQYTIVTAEVAQVAQTSAFDVRLNSAHVAREVVPREGAEPMRTSQRWVAVEYQITAHRERLRTDQAWLIATNGDRYAAREEFQALTRGTVDPGFQHTGTVVFEVPPEAVAEAVVQIGPAHVERRPWELVVRVDPQLTDVPVLDILQPEPAEVRVAS